MRGHIGDVISRDASGAFYSIEDFPDLTVKEGRLSSPDANFAELVEPKLKSVDRSPRPGILRYRQVVKDRHSVLLFMKRHDVSLERFIAGHREASRPVPKEQVFSIPRQLVDALARLHDPA